MDVDGEILVLARGALRLLRTRSATLAASDVGMSSIPDIQTDEVEWLASRAEITVAFGKKGETIGTVERTVLPRALSRVRMYGVIPRSINHCRNSPLPYVASAATDAGSRPCHSAKRAIMSWAATVSWLMRAAVACTPTITQL